MKKPRKTQYTIRSVPTELDKALRRRARQNKQSLNQAALEAMRRGMNLDKQKVTYHDLDHLFGSMPADPEFDKVLEEQRQIDPDMWK